MTDATTRPRWRAFLPWIIAAIVVIIVLSAVWIAFKLLGAYASLTSAADGAKQLQSAVLDGDLSNVEALADDVAEDAADARAQTSDPVWRTWEFVPVLGTNLRAVREVSEIIDDVADDAVDPLLAAAAEVDIATLGFSGGQVDIAALEAASPHLAEAAVTFADARSRSDAIDTSLALPPVAAGVTEMRQVVTGAADAVIALSQATQVLPTILGRDGPRTYLLLMQNNAEVRSSGGIPGAFAVIEARNGRIAMTAQASTSNFERVKQSVLPLSPATIALFGDEPGLFVQNTTNVPDFPTAAALAAALWQDSFSQHIDGVIAVDAVAMTDLLVATGKLEAGGYTITADNAIQTLLSDVYRDHPEFVDQDVVFAAVTAALFDRITGSDASIRPLLTGLAVASADHRIRVWSSHDSEQAVIAETTISGVIPEDTPNEATVGVFFNDTTGAKMDFYTDAAIDVEYSSCGADDGRVRVQVDWTNGAPADAATSLPEYVTGSGKTGVTPGSVRTRIAVYGPENWTPSLAEVDGKSFEAEPAMDGRRIAIQHEVVLAPGETARIVVEFEGTTSPETFDVLSTPRIEPIPTTVESVGCTG